MADINLFDDEIKDEYARENFVRLRRFVRGTPLLKGNFVFFEVSLAKASAGAAYPATVSFAHGFNYVPTDVIQLACSPDSATVTWKYDSFTREKVYLTISAACTIRAFIGRYGE